MGNYLLHQACILYHLPAGSSSSKLVAVQSSISFNFHPFVAGSILVMSDYFSFISGASVASAAPVEVNFDLLIKNIEELNTLAGEGEHIISHTTRGARLKVLILQFQLIAEDLSNFTDQLHPLQYILFRK